MANVGKRLQQIRKLRKITQEQLAEILNTNRVRISNIENGKTDMTFNEAVRLCNEFKISIDSFLDEQKLSSEDYIVISKRYIKNKDISSTERREILKQIHIEFETECFNDLPMINVLKSDKIVQKAGKRNKSDIDKFSKEE